MIRQVKIRDNSCDTDFGGIMLDNGDIICGCCGSLIPHDELNNLDYDFTLIKIYDNWMNISNEILGDDKHR